MREFIVILTGIFAVLFALWLMIDTVCEKGCHFPQLF